MRMGCCAITGRQIHPENTAPLTAVDLTTLQDMWPTVSESKERFGVFVYNSFLSREREIWKLFPRMVLEDGEEKFRIDPAEVRRHALLVVDGLGLAVEYLRDMEKLNRFLRNIGARHYRASVKPEMLMKLYPAMDEGLKDVLGKRYAKRQRQAFRSFFLYIVRVFKAAMTEAAGAGNCQHAKRHGSHSVASWSSGIGTASTCSTKSTATLV